ncbi:hypothetical protein BH23GEM9_BH23GEM9_02440 [soil metagenome]
MSRASLAVLAAIVLAGLGMTLVIGGVIVTGLFLPGVTLIILSAIAFAAAAVLHAAAGDSGARTPA